MDTDQLKVLHVYNGGKVGGVGMIFKRTILALKGAGVQQYLLLGSSLDLPDAAISHQYVSFKNRYLNVSTYFSVWAAIKSFRPDIIQTWQHRANKFVRGPFYKLRDQQIPVIRFIAQPFAGRVFKKYYADSALLLMPSMAVQQQMIQEGWHSDRSAVLRHFCETELTQSLSRSHYGAIPDSALLIVTAGRLTLIKGFDVLLHALVSMPNAYLWLLGTGDEEANLKSLAETLGIASRVFFIGWRHNVASHFASADVVVIPSREESFGLVIIEALTQAKPVITTKTQGGCEIIIEKKNGLLCEIDNPMDMTNKIELLFDPELRQRIGNNARNYVLDNYNPDRAISELLNEYNRVLP